MKNTNYYIIGYGLSGGFGGIQDYEVIIADSLDEAEGEAGQQARETYDSYAGLHGLRDVSEIVEEDEVDEDTAYEIYEEEREGWLEYVAFEYSKEKEEELEDWGIHNPYRSIMEQEQKDM